MSVVDDDYSSSKYIGLYHPTQWYRINKYDQRDITENGEIYTVVPNITRIED
jgi:hypothetical protein